jgi:hypothetical protein
VNDIQVGYEEANIACTIVLLKAKVGAGMMKVPLVVELALGTEAGWRAAAIAHLDAPRAPQIPRENSAGHYQELNEEFDWYDRKARQ